MSCAMARNCKFRNSALIFSCWAKLIISKAQHKSFSPLMGDAYLRCPTAVWINEHRKDNLVPVTGSQEVWWRPSRPQKPITRLKRVAACR